MGLNGMVTEEQGRRFLAWLDAAEAISAGLDNLVGTQERPEDFEAATIEYRRLRREQMDDGTRVVVLEASQRHRGETRRDLYIADFGSARAVYAS